MENVSCLSSEGLDNDILNSLKRARFALECIDALIDVWGPNKVGIKLSPALGRGDLGMFPVERQIEQFTYLIKELDKRPMAYINLVRYLGMSSNRLKHWDT